MDQSPSRMAEENTFITETKNPKKRRVLGSISDANKKRRLSTHETGPNCMCTRLQCFENVSENERNRIIAHFNELSSKAEQDAYLSKYIEVLPVQQPRSRKKDTENEQHHNFSYQYFVPTLQPDEFTKVSVCVKAFCSIHGITVKRVRYIRESIARIGKFR